MPGFKIESQDHLSIHDEQQLPVSGLPHGWKDFLIANQGKSLVVVFEDCMAYEVTLTRDGKRLAAQFRHITEDKQQEFMKQKVATYDNYHGVVTASLSAAGFLTCAAAPFFGATAAGAQLLQFAWQGVNQGIDAAEKQLTNKDQGQHAAIDHNSSTSRTAMEDYRAQMSQKDQHFNESQSLRDRIANLKSELFRSVAN
jgi:hypothetical protein